MNVADVARVSRLALVMQLRDATFAPVALAAAKSGEALLVGASAHGHRIEIAMAYTSEVHAALAANAVALRGATQVRVCIDRDDSEVMFVRRGRIDPEAAVAEVAPASVREAWLELVGQLASIADARISAVGRSADATRGMLQVSYPARDRDTDAMLVEAIDQLGEGIGVSAAQRTLFRRIHPQVGRGAEIVVATRCSSTGVSPNFAISYPVTAWEIAVRLASGLVLNDSEGKEVARRLGEVAGAVGADHLTGLELVLGPHEPPDVVVWANVAPR